MIVYYRISGSQKIKDGQFSNWERSLDNFKSVFRSKIDRIVFVGDNLTPRIKDHLSQQEDVLYTELGNSGSFKFALEQAIKEDGDQIIYFVEDDYLHRQGSDVAIVEGLDISDYVTLYDHADKYQKPYTNEWGGEPTRVLLTKSTHWKQVSSTCMTFAAKVKTLREDQNIIKHYLKSPIPEDWAMFTHLKTNGRKLISSIPGYATHCLEDYKSPLIDWSKI